MFRKDCFFSKTDWYDARKFAGNMRDPASKIPWEPYIHNILTQLPGLDNVVRLRTGGAYIQDYVDHESRSFRLYVEWCPHGDLHDLICRSAKDAEDIPEPWLWNVAECLFECVAMMKDGSLEGRNRPADWCEIVHRYDQLYRHFFMIRRANTQFGTET